MRSINRDLFEEKTMPFGDHLDELRTVLMRSLVGVAVAFLVGLFVAKPVIRLIEQPLRRNLVTYLTKRGLDQLAEQQNPVDEAFRQTIRDRQLVLREMYLEQSVLEHLSSLSEISSATGTTAPIPVSSQMIRIRLWEPAQTKLVVLSTTEPFVTWLKAAFFCGLIISAPYVLWQIWSFVAAGLYQHERRSVMTFLPLSIALFVGAATAFLLVFDPVLEFLFSYAAKLHIELTPRLTDWMSFVLFLPFGFGIAFQLPLVMLAINRLRIVSIGGYLQHWRTAILAICVMSMVLTPQEPISMLAMAIPLTFLYFLGVVLCYIVDRRSRRNPLTGEVVDDFPARSSRE